MLKLIKTFEVSQNGKYVDHEEGIFGADADGEIQPSFRACVVPNQQSGKVVEVPSAFTSLNEIDCQVYHCGGVDVVQRACDYAPGVQP